jgi:hypothetical protein
VDSGDTLSTLAGKVNSLGLGLSATVVTDSSGAHLQIAATGSGAVSVSADPAFSMTRAGTAHCRVGYDPDQPGIVELCIGLQRSSVTGEFAIHLQCH